MITHPQLKTKLATIDAEYSAELREWRNNPKVMQWCRQNDLITESGHLGWLETHVNDPSIRMYLILDAGYLPIGVCGLTGIDLINQRAEFSLYIAADFQGKGYGADALKLLCFHGFNSLPLNIIWGESFEGNRAMRIFRDVGFVEEGIRRDFYFRNGKHIDAMLFSIKRDELRI